ncbi:MAG TPA: GntR family transcriptional regulator [Opitutaceae bacterium]|jgi:LacI family transcriptional regulator|nr:GntR family transcriptional regulator [Opitutaceae bacterium]
MSLTFKRASLVAQVADAIRSQIHGGTWREWIPSERELSNSLHVSRNTCRFALHMIYREGLAEPIQGRGIRVKRATPASGGPAVATRHSVGVIIPEPIGRLRPSNALMIEELQAELYDMGVRLQLHSSPAYYGGNPRHALEKLVEKNPHDCWILVLSQRPLQSWFMQRGLPCVISGSIYDGVELPSVDFDLRAVCRHAVGMLLAQGHRRIVFFNRQLRAAGDLDSEMGFHEGVRGTSYEQVEARVVYHDDHLASVASLTKQLFKGSMKPPSALIVANPYCYLSVMSTLARLGFRVPDDVSLISRDDDPFLNHVDPEPARYIYDVTHLARKVMFLVRSLLDGGLAKRDAVRIVPHFSAGGSVRKQ